MSEHECRERKPVGGLTLEKLLHSSQCVWRARPPILRRRIERFTVKFKAVFVLFNLVIVVSFLVIYLMPLAMLGWDYTRTFWSENWGLPVLFGLILVGLNVYFARNWRLFRLLEQEDWDGLIEHLEHRIYKRNTLVQQQCRILVNAYLVRSRLDDIARLEREIRDRRPKLLKALVMPIGIRYLLGNDPEASSAYFGEFVDQRCREAGWVRFSHGFALLLSDDREGAATAFRRVIEEERDRVLLLLTLYLAEGIEPGTWSGHIDELCRRTSPEKLTSRIERERSRVQVVILSRLIDEAKEWLFRDSSSEAS